MLHNEGKKLYSMALLGVLKLRGMGRGRLSRGGCGFFVGRRRMKLI
jgi:hypothetical protein